MPPKNMTDCLTVRFARVGAPDRETRTSSPEPAAPDFSGGSDGKGLDWAIIDPMDSKLYAVVVAGS